VAGESDIATASRAIHEDEIESCRAIGREPVEFRVGTDGLAVVVSSENDFVTDVTMEELALIFSDGAVMWSDVRPEWPQEDILRFIPGTDSGTFDYFVEVVFDENNEPHLAASNTQLSEDDNVLSVTLTLPRTKGICIWWRSMEWRRTSRQWKMAVTYLPGRSSCTPIQASCKRSRKWLTSSTSS
jgi:hypothetical protein